MKASTIGLIIFIILINLNCQRKEVPKPRGFFRISFPEKSYNSISYNIPYHFEIPTYSEMIPDSGINTEPYWYNIMVPDFNAEIHISYKNLSIPEYNMDNQILSKYTEESRFLAYGHTIKADAITEQLFINPLDDVYGTIYFIEGNAASPLQFYLTDSTNHFLRGALYLKEVPNIDSLKPVINFLKPDIIHLIETTTWN